MKTPMVWSRIQICGIPLCLVALAVPALAVESRTYILAGQVIDDQARPVEEASVAAYDDHFTRQQGLVQTKANGQFRFEFSEPYLDLVLVSQKAGLALGWNITSDPYGTTLILGKPHRLAGTVMDEAGKPLPEATVRVILYHRNLARWRGDSSQGGLSRILALQKPEDWLTVKTDREGRFTFDSIPANTTADFQVAAPGRARSCTYRDEIGRGCQFAAGRADIRLVLGPEAVIQGKVVEEDTDRPVSGVQVAAIPKGSHAKCCRQEPVVSDEKGTFCFKGLATGSYVLQLDNARSAMPEWVGKEVEISVKSGQAIDDVKILVNKGGILEVLVRDEEDDVGVCGASVRVEQKSQVGGPSSEWVGTTDTNGLALFRLIAGENTIQAYKENLGAILLQDEVVTIDKGQTRRCTVDLPHNAIVVSGRVLDPDRRPVEGAWVRDLLNPLTDKEGRFEIRGWYLDPPSSSRDVLIRQESLGLAAEAILRDPNKAGRPQGEVTLRPASTITGRLTDPSGKAVPIAYVMLLCKYSTRRITEVVTDANGMYQIRAIPASLSKSHPLTLVARVEGYGTREVPCPVFEDANRVVQLDPIVLQPATESVSGVVVDANDKTVSGAVLAVLGPGGREDLEQPLCHAIADDQGRFRIDGVCKGSLRLSVSGGHLDAYGGAQDLKVVLGRQLVHTGQRSLLARPLPDLAEVGDRSNPNEVKDQTVLVCFFDVGQRPSRNMVQQIAKRAATLKEKGLAIFVVQAEPTDPNALAEWIKKNEITLPICIIPGDSEKVRLAWNVKSLPWLILTDRTHTVRTEGLGLEAIPKP